MASKFYSQTEIQTRLEIWSNLPATDAKHFMPRQRAWHKYCDARDQLPEGTSEKNYLGRPIGGNDRQLEMFRKVRAS